MDGYPTIIEELIDRLKKLPGIGQRSGERIVNALLEWKREDITGLAESVLALKDRVQLCQRCFNLSEESLCRICRDPNRTGVILVVEEVRDLAMVEKTGFRGTYHVLGGRISTMEHVGPEHLRIKELLDRIEREPVQEVIIGTNPTPEGEDTAVYLAGILKTTRVPHSRLACGLPVGAEMEYVDSQTLKRSIEGRKPL